MKRHSWSIFILTTLVCWGCAAPRVVKVWQPWDPEPIAYNNILVTAITRHKADTTNRAILERHTVDYFSEKGVEAVSSLALFGHDGFRLFAEEAVYAALCKKGVDAVLTLAEIKESESIPHENSFGKKSTSVYYYDHIWNYRNQKEVSPNVITPITSNYVWECILFDLNTLQPRTVLLVRPMNDDGYKTTKERLVKEVINKLIKEKIIKAKAKQDSLKAF